MWPHGGEIRQDKITWIMIELIRKKRSSDGVRSYLAFFFIVD